jgi:hypothetical protein
MPLGTFHTISGTLAWTPQGFTLFLDEGGYWALELGWRDFRRARGLLGERVEAEGVRIGFNVLEVRRLKRCSPATWEVVVEAGGVRMRAKKSLPPS